MCSFVPFNGGHIFTHSNSGGCPLLTAIQVLDLVYNVWVIGLQTQLFVRVLTGFMASSHQANIDTIGTCLCHV